MEYQTLLHLHLWLAVLFLVSYTIKSLLFLFGSREKFIAFKEKTIVVETLLSVGFLVFGFWLMISHFKNNTYPHWLDPKISLAIIAIPLGILGFKKGNKVLVALSLLFFLVALIIGLLHYH